MNDLDYMKIALSLAKGAQGQTLPNPTVGAVVVKDGDIIGLGAHLKAGEPHAEVHALKMAGAKARGATMYVTLEPCSHHGRTPPCADLLIEAGITKVVIATTDPNPLVAGKGIERLTEAGITVEVGLLQEEANDLNQEFFHYVKTGHPYVTLKAAMTLDGKIATKTGESKWISSNEAREDVHLARSQHMAILVGVGTVLADNPLLTVRRKNGSSRQPIRIILDSRLQTPEQAQVVVDRSAPTWIITGPEVDEAKRARLEACGVEVHSLAHPPHALEDVLSYLGKKGIVSIYVEGGAEVHGSFLTEKAFQQLVVYIAPKLFGGSQAKGVFGGAGIEQIADALELAIKEVKLIGSDLRLTAIVKGG